MTRLAGIAVYAMVAALVLVAPLSASEEAVPPDPAAPEAAEPEAAGPEAAPPESEQPEVAPAEPVPAPAAEAPDEVEPGAPPAEPAPAAEPPAEQPAPAPAAGPAPEEVAAEGPKKAKRDRAGRRVRAKAAASTSVTIRDFEFAPVSVTIDAGDTVTWNNQGPTPHSATADNGSFDTGILDDGQSGSHTFDEAGTFSYFCTPHPNMRGTITVRAASAGGSGGDTSGDSGAGDSAAGTDADTGPTLAATGLDAGGLAALGVVTLMLGVWLRRRAASAG